MALAPFIWKDGRILPWEDATMHIVNQGLHYGVACFEGIRFYKTESGPAIFRLQEHLERFFRSLRTLRMRVSYSLEDLKKATIAIVKKTELEEGYIRPIAWYAAEKLGLHATSGEVSVAIIVIPWKKGSDQWLKAEISPLRRIHPYTTDVESKISGHYINSLQALWGAQERGFDEAIMLDHKGFVAEASGSNIFMVKNGIFITPAPGTILSGITRDTILTILRDIRIYPDIRFDISPQELKQSDEVFVCGTAMEVTPVRLIDDTFIGVNRPDLFTRLVRELYADAVRARGYAGHSQQWLTFLQDGT